MKSFLITLFLFTGTLLSAQTWVNLMNNPASNYYDVENSFLQWKDSVSKNSDLNNLPVVFHHKESEEQKEMIEEADEKFYRWADEIKYKIDPNGNRIQAQNPTQQMQGTWISRGPTNLIGSGAGSYGIGMTISIAINHVDTNIVYLVSSCGSLWKSINDGNNWGLLTETSPGFSFSYIKTDPIDGNTLYAVISGNLYKSIDGAVTWTQLNVVFNSSSFKLLIDPSNPQNLFLASLSNGIQKSIDGGSTWSTINPTYYHDIEFNPLNSNVILGFGASNTVVRSNDGGVTFTSSASIPVNYGISELAVTLADTSYVYVLSVDGNYHGQVAVSTDGGATFTVRPVSSNMLDGVSYHFEVSPVDKNLIIHAGLRCSRSTDGGMTWNWAASQYYTFTNPPFEHVDNRFVMFNGSSFWSCNDGGVYKSVDGGLTWTDKTPGLAITNFTALASSETDSSVFVGGSWDNSILIHHSAGWSDIFLGDGYNVAIKPSDPLTVYGKNQYSYSRTFNGNSTAGAPFAGLTESIYGFTAVYPIQFNHQNPNSMYLLAANVWKSTNNGNSATQISNFSSNTGGGFLYVCNTDSNVIFTTYYHTSDNGVTWIPNTKKVIAVDPDEPNKVWARNSPSEAFGIFYSSDSGTTWTAIPSLDLNLNSNSPLGLRCANNIHNGVYLFTGYSIYYSDDRLSNWQPFSNGLPRVTISDMNVLSNFGKMRISTSGRGIWESNLYDSTQALSVNFIADKYSVCPGDTVHFYDNSLNNGPGFNPVYQWSFQGGTPSTSSAANPQVVYSSTGTYNVTLIVTNTNGTDTLTQSMYINVNTAPLVTTPLVEGFELPETFPPANWNVNHYSSTPLWVRSIWANSGGYATSQKSLEYLYNGTSTSSGYFTTPVFNFASVFDPVLVFDYCYPMDTLYPDTLKIFYSTDCGLTRNYIYTKGGQDIRTATQTIFTFMPNASTWKTDTLHLFPIQ
ncbi:MAG TPA: PKD domain-containing protein, partial [Bacteroidia bacterium]|nr:PKD domain-containing protein [Bacteroidia bacterium]